MQVALPRIQSCPAGGRCRRLPLKCKAFPSAVSGPDLLIFGHDRRVELQPTPSIDARRPPISSAICCLPTILDGFLKHLATGAVLAAR